ncbi:MAG: TolC family protein [Betaproteobacteria bacterium]|nr:MAG: TolC family protein [Betaproteobacteria bacterium]
MALALAAPAASSDRDSPGGAANGGPVHAADSVLRSLLSEAVKGNPEIRAAAREQDAASQRVSVAGALDDPMLEAGLLSVPTRSFSFSREDMTMKMLGLSQRFPYPGKLELRRQVAQGEADVVAHAYRETVNRIVRDIKLAYLDLALVAQSLRAVTQNRALVEQLLKLAEGRYAVAQAGQIDVLRAQTAFSRMTEELIRFERERPVLEAELNRLLGRSSSAPPLVPGELALKQVTLARGSLYEQALRQRPQLLSLQAMVARSERALELARKERYPDFDVRVSYGQRDSMPDGTPRSDLVSFTVAINLPVWRETKVEPRIAEAQSRHEQALEIYEAQRNETAAKLRQQAVIAEQSARVARLYAGEIAPQAQLGVEAAAAAYQVNRIEFAALLDNRMAVLNAEIARAAAVAAHNKALAEIDFLVGNAVADASDTRPAP